MRILHILDHSIPLHSGYTFRTRAILREQRQLGWETFHITSAKHVLPAPPEEEVDGLRFFRTPGGGWPSRLPLVDQWWVVHTLRRRLAQVVERIRPDVLHAHSPALNGLAALQVARQYGLPLVYEVRAFWEDAAVDHGTSREGGPRYRATRALESYVLRRARQVTTICEGLREDIVARGVPASRVTVIPNAVDVEHFSQHRNPDSALVAQLGLEDARVLGFIGSFYAYEGLALLIEALPQLLAADPGIRLLLVGGGPQERHLKELARQRGLEDKIRFVGRVPHDQVDRYYDLVEVLVYPRLSMRLTELVTPLKPLEAMAQGRLVAASNVGGHRELIRPGENGVLFAADDPHDLAVRVQALLVDRLTQERLRRQGRAFVEQERTWAASVARYRHVYEDLQRPGRVA